MPRSVKIDSIYPNYTEDTYRSYLHRYPQILLKLPSQILTDNELPGYHKCDQHQE